MKKNNKKTAKVKAVNNKKSSGRTPMYIILGVISFLLVLTVSLAAVYWYTNPQTDDENPFESLPVSDENNVEKPEQDTTQTKKPQSADGRNNNMYNLMVIGKDYWSGSTDVIMIMSINTETDEISVLQIPRDSTVDCGVNENHGKRVNAIYAYARQALRTAASNPKQKYDDPVMAKVAPMYISGLKEATDSDARKYNSELLDKMGLEYLRETIKRTFCIAIDGYVMVDISGFREIVDVLGGVEVDVPMNMHYEDPEQNLYIHINKGVQTLNGKQAEGFVRYRYGYVDGDIGRVNAQKIFVTALAKKLLSFSTITKLQPIIETCLEYTTTNLSLSSIIGYAKIILGMDLNSIKFYTCPGEAYRTSSGAWYYSLYMNENLEIINAHFNDYDRQVTPEDVTLREVVRNYNISYDNQGISAEDIENNKLDVQHSAVTYNPVDTPASSTVTTPVLPSDDTSEDENESNGDENTPTEPTDNSSDEKEENETEAPEEITEGENETDLTESPENDGSEEDKETTETESDNTETSENIGEESDDKEPDTSSDENKNDVEADDVTDTEASVAESDTVEKENDEKTNASDDGKKESSDSEKEYSDSKEDEAEKANSGNVGESEETLDEKTDVTSEEKTDDTKLNETDTENAESAKDDGNAENTEEPVTDTITDDHNDQE